MWHQRNLTTRIHGLTVLASAGLWTTLSLLGGCETQKPPAKPADRPQSAHVYTTFYPTTYFAQRIVGDQVQITNPCPPDADPAFWMPDEQTIQAYQNATLIIINGASFEKWIGKVSLPPSRIVDTTKPFSDEFIVLEGTVTHAHGPSGAHTHEGIDGHTWLDPVLARTQAEQIKNALAKRLPAHKATFEAGFAALADDLDTLDARHKALADKLGGEFLLCSHPAYNYVGRRYGWKLKSFFLDPEEMPGDDTIKDIRNLLATQPARFILWEAEPTAEITTRFREELNLTSIVFSPCEALDAGQLEQGADFLTVMNGNMDRLEKALGT